MCARACVYVCVRACVIRACVHVSACVCARASVCVCVKSKDREEAKVTPPHARAHTHTHLSDNASGASLPPLRGTIGRNRVQNRQCNPQGNDDPQRGTATTQDQGYGQIGSGICRVMMIHNEKPQLNRFEVRVRVWVRVKVGVGVRVGGMVNRSCDF